MSCCEKLLLMLQVNPSLSCCVILRWTARASPLDGTNVCVGVRRKGELRTWPTTPRGTHWLPPSPRIPPPTRPLCLIILTFTPATPSDFWQQRALVAGFGGSILQMTITIHRLSRMLLLFSIDRLTDRYAPFYTYHGDVHIHVFQTVIHDLTL